VQQKVTIVNPDLTTYLFCKPMILIQTIYGNFNNVPITKHGDQMAAPKFLVLRGRTMILFIQSCYTQLNTNMQL